MERTSPVSLSGYPARLASSLQEAERHARTALEQIQIARQSAVGQEYPSVMLATHNARTATDDAGNALTTAGTLAMELQSAVYEATH